MKVKLDYGKNGLEVELPNQNVVGILRLSSKPPISDPIAAIRAAIAAPIGTRTLCDLAKGRKNACIVICDITHPVPNQTILPVIVDAIESSGIHRKDITILIATGTHRPNEGSELIELIGAELAGSITVINHHCECADEQVSLGMSPRGVPVLLDKTYVQADFKITIGLIEPHFMAGFSGGRKLIMPGLAALETVQAWHSPQFLEHPLATNGVLEGNPVHEESLSIAKMCPPDMVLDVTLNETNQITGVFAGDLEEAWLTGVEFAGEQVRASLPEPVDIVVTTCAGAPLDVTFYQAVKGMVGALPIIKPGGEIIIASSCSEGIGGPHFRNLLFETDDLGDLMERMQSPGWTFIPDQWEVEELARVVKKASVTCVCDGISDLDLRRCFVSSARSVESAVDRAIMRIGPDATIAVIPKGPYVISEIKSLS